MPINNTSLNEIYKAVAPEMDMVEVDLKTLLAGIPNGGDITTAQLLKLQVAIAKYTVTSTVFSNVLKEFSDSLKGVASKIG